MSSAEHSDLVVVQGRLFQDGRPRQRIGLSPGVTRGGRSRENELVFADPAVSRFQMELHLERGLLTLVVNEGAAPLYVGGVRVEHEVELCHGAVIEVGSTQMRVERGAEALLPGSSSISTLERHPGATTVGVLKQSSTPPASPSRRYLLLLGQLGEALRRFDHPEEVHQRMLEHLQSCLPVSRVMIATRAEGQSRFVPQAWLVEEGDTDGADFQISQTLLERILAEDTLCAFEEVPVSVTSDSIINTGVRSALAAPLRDGKRLRGILYADNCHQEVRFSEDDRAFFAAIAGFTAVTLGAGRRMAALKEGIKALPDDEDAEKLVGASAAFATTMERALRFARMRSSVLILGPPGSGKSMMARFIHRRSRRAAGPLVQLNCAAIPAGVAEAELFGIAPGSGVAGAAAGGRPGSFQLASGGTLFLDEVGELPEELQAKLLAALREGLVTPVGAGQPQPVDVRVISATNRDIRVEEDFRRDLLARIGSLQLVMPSLEERKEDIPVLARYLLERILREEELSESYMLSVEAAAHLQARSWPGNVAELENVLREAVAMADQELLSVEDLPAMPTAPATPEHPLVSCSEMEHRHIEAVLAALDWNKAQAAEVLDISRPTLDAKINKYGLHPPTGIEIRPGRKASRRNR